MRYTTDNCGNVNVLSSGLAGLPGLGVTMLPGSRMPRRASYRSRGQQMAKNLVESMVLLVRGNEGLDLPRDVLANAERIARNIASNVDTSGARPAASLADLEWFASLPVSRAEYAIPVRMVDSFSAYLSQVVYNGVPWTQERADRYKAVKDRVKARLTADTFPALRPADVREMYLLLSMPTLPETLQTRTPRPRFRQWFSVNPTSIFSVTRR